MTEKFDHTETPSETPGGGDASLDSMRLSLPTPSLPRRAGAFLVDQALAVLATGWTIMPALLGRVGSDLDEALQAQLRSYAAPLMPQAFLFFYFAVTHAVWGKSLGKRALGLEVTTVNGGRISPGIAVVRALVTSGICALPLAGLLVSPGVFKLGLLAAILYVMADAIAALSNPEQRAMHDIFVDTRVVVAGKQHLVHNQM